MAATSDHVSATRPFDLIRWFLILGLAAIAVVSVATSLLFSRFLTHHMLERDGVMMMESVQAVVRIEDALGVFKAGPQVGPDTNAEAFFAYISSMPDVMRANVYSAEGTVIWSTDKSLVGTQYGSNPELDEALAGRLKVEHGVVGDEHQPKPEHVNLGQRGDSYVENYIPIFDPADRQLIGVVELYRIPRALFQSLREGVQLMWVAAIAAGAFLFLTLFGLIRRADGTMRAQQRRLIETETLAVVGQLSGAVAHSLRNPLSSIRSSAELALDGPITEARETSSDIIIEVDRLEGMVRQLLLYSQAPGGEIGELDVRPMLEEVLQGFARDADKRRAKLELDVAGGLPRVRADGVAIAQVFNSLLANALDALSPGGTIAIAARPAPVGQMVEIAIRDTGKGIPREQMGDLFKPFHTTKAKGLGMGLALADRIVRRFGGTLAIDSEQGVGTVVKVSLRAGSTS
jgi:two-component system, NtrC family, sensor histidine kinase HydH